MSTFRFRAAAALDLRRKQEDAARIEAARAEMAAQAARERSDEAQAKVGDEARRLAGLQQDGIEAWRAQWHRAWIHQQRNDAAARATELSARTADAAQAGQAVRDAMKKRRVLERLRDRAWRRHKRVAHEQHVRDMNELATLRFVAQIAEEGGTRAD